MLSKWPVTHLLAILQAEVTLLHPIDIEMGKDVTLNKLDYDAFFG